MTPVGGGVTIHPDRALQSQNVLPDEDDQVAGVREGVSMENIPADRWWWD
jgi:hypothetical protein